MTHRSSSHRDGAPPHPHSPSLNTPEDDSATQAPTSPVDSPEGGGPANAMWGGRFADGPHAVMQAINASIDVDRRFAEEDIEGSLAHVAMLAHCGIIATQDAQSIAEGLRDVRQALREGRVDLTPEHEDIHLNVEAALTDRIGPVAGRLHTARSRNDQVATDFRLWTRKALARTADLARALQRALVDQASAHADTLMPGFTHLQTAQPVTFGHHCLAYVEMLERDRARMADAAARLNESPLGAAALAGTPYPIDREMTAKTLGFDRPMANSLDAVSARDFAMEALSAWTICAVHVSRLADEIVLWTSPQFAFASLSDRWSTGSSIMPQKRNPDAAELARGKVGRLAGAFQHLVLVMKALPLAYAKDLQEDKAPVFAAYDDLELVLTAMAGMIADLSVNKDAMAAAAGLGHATATDLADWLVREAGAPFREAHHITGAIVAEADRRGAALHQVPVEAMKAIDDRITEAVFDVLSPQASAASRTSYGGTAPARVREQVASWKERLA